MIFFDISILVNHRANTGIQRVLKEILKQFILNKEIDFSLVYFDEPGQFYKEIDLKSFLDYLISVDVKNFEFSYKSKEILIEDFTKYDIFFDIDAYWNSKLKRSYLYPVLKKNNVKICNIVHDVVPVKFPHYAHENTLRNFLINIAATYRYSDITFFPSRSTEKDYFEIAEKVGIEIKGSTRVVKWGMEITNIDIKIEQGLQKILNSKYILFVGTIEPRKRQDLTLKVFEKLVQKFPDCNLVFIGKAGWNNDVFINKLKNHPLLNKNIFWLKNINDSELVKFYQNAYLNIYLSTYEGFGLPILESLSYGNITITSKNSSMYEVGRNFADYIEYNSYNELYEILELYFDNKELYYYKQRYIKEKFVPYSWNTTYKSVLNSLNNILNSDKIIKDVEKLQFVFISINHKNLEGTIKAIDLNIDFVKEYIIVTNDEKIDKIRTLKSKYQIKVINEKEILGDLYELFTKKDHVTKNWMLRASLLKIDCLDKQFIMLDDDNRPLKRIDITHYIENYRYNIYYFYDLLNWSCYNTDYDIGQHNMKDILNKDGYEMLSYSCHKPQIIDKDIFQEVVDKYFDVGLETPIDEWSMYFNYAVSNYPILFNKRIYDVLNWPAYPSDWEQEYFQNEYNFENYYEYNFQGNYKEKIEHKLLEEKPYKQNKILKLNNNSLCAKYNMIHGILTFQDTSVSVFLSNIPYYIEAKENTWYKLIINYKIINSLNKDIVLLYYINQNEDYRLNLFIEDIYTDSVIEFPISFKSLKPNNFYDILIDIEIDGKKIYGFNSPYLVKLFVK